MGKLLPRNSAETQSTVILMILATPLDHSSFFWPLHPAPHLHKIWMRKCSFCCLDNGTIAWSEGRKEGLCFEGISEHSAAQHWLGIGAHRCCDDAKDTDHVQKESKGRAHLKGVGWLGWVSANHFQTGSNQQIAGKTFKTKEGQGKTGKPRGIQGPPAKK